MRYNIKGIFLFKHMAHFDLMAKNSILRQYKRMDWNEESSGFPGNSRQRSLEGDSLGGTTNS